MTVRIGAGMQGKHRAWYRLRLVMSAGRMVSRLLPHWLHSLRRCKWGFNWNITLSCGEVAHWPGRSKKNYNYETNLALFFFFNWRTETTVTPQYHLHTDTWFLIGHLPAQGGICGRLLGGHSDGCGLLRGWGPMLHRLGGKCCAVCSTQINLVA